MGHEVTSSWLDELAHPKDMDNATFNKKLAIKDLGEVRAADMLILDTLGQRSSGKQVEFGAAISSINPKIVYIVGPVTSTFHYLADKQFNNWEECLHALHQNGEAGRPRPTHPAASPSN